MCRHCHGTKQILRTNMKMTVWRTVSIEWTNPICFLIRDFLIKRGGSAVAVHRQGRQSLSLKVVNVPVVLVVQVPQVQIVEETVDIPQLQFFLEIRTPLPAESTPKFVTAPVLEAPVVVCMYNPFSCGVRGAERVHMQRSHLWEWHQHPQCQHGSSDHNKTRTGVKNANGGWPISAIVCSLLCDGTVARCGEPCGWGVSVSWRVTNSFKTVKLTTVLSCQISKWVYDCWSSVVTMCWISPAGCPPSRVSHLICLPVSLCLSQNKGMLQQNADNIDSMSSGSLSPVASKGALKVRNGKVAWTWGQCGFCGRMWRWQSEGLFQSSERAQSVFWFVISSLRLKSWRRLVLSWEKSKNEKVESDVGTWTPDCLWKLRRVDLSWHNGTSAPSKTLRTTQRERLLSSWLLQTRDQLTHVWLKNLDNDVNLVAPSTASWFPAFPYIALRTSNFGCRASVICAKLLLHVDPAVPLHARKRAPQHRGTTKDGDHPQTPDHEKQLLWMEHAGYSLKS